MRQVANSSKARQLFSNIIKVKNIKVVIQPAGSVERKRTLGIVYGFLKWASGSKSNHILPEDFKPPDEIEAYILQKSERLIANAKSPTPTLTDEEIEEDIAACRVESLDTQDSADQLIEEVVTVIIKRRGLTDKSESSLSNYVPHTV